VFGVRFGTSRFRVPGSHSEFSVSLRAHNKAGSKDRLNWAPRSGGVLLGTAAYMSPEQARGRPVERRADIWAFRCVLYEMLTGRRAFEAEDVPLTLSQVLQRDPTARYAAGRHSRAGAADDRSLFEKTSERTDARYRRGAADAGGVPDDRCSSNGAAS